MAITDHEIQRRDGKILLGIALENAVLDIVTDQKQLDECIRLLNQPHQGLVSAKMGSFGDFEIAMNVHHDETVTIFIDGPEFDPPRDQSAGLYLDKHELLTLLTDTTRNS